MRVTLLYRRVCWTRNTAMFWQAVALARLGPDTDAPGGAVARTATISIACPRAWQTILCTWSGIARALFIEVGAGVATMHAVVENGPVSVLRAVPATL